jgi:hypothetical protein
MSSHGSRNSDAGASRPVRAHSRVVSGVATQSFTAVHWRHTSCAGGARMVVGVEAATASASASHRSVRRSVGVRAAAEAGVAAEQTAAHRMFSGIAY